MTELDDLYKKYDDLREAYLKKFKEEAPFYLPIETPDAIEEMAEAIRTDVALESTPEDVVT